MGGYSNEDMYEQNNYPGYPSHDQRQYLAEEDTLPTDAEGDPSFYYDSVDASAMGYGGDPRRYPQDSNRFVDQNRIMPPQQNQNNSRFQDGPLFDPQTGQRFLPRNHQQSSVYNSVMQDSLEVTTANDASRYEDVNAALIRETEGRSRNNGSSGTINEPSMSFGSQAAGVPVFTGQDYNSDVDAHQHAINIQSGWRGYNTRQSHNDPNNEYQRDDSRYEVYDPPSRAHEERSPSKNEGYDNHDHSATVIQKNYRGYRARKDYKLRKEKAEKAKVIQSSYRGYKARRKYVNEQPVVVSSAKHTHRDNRLEQDKAATKIQSQYRGYKTRKDLKSNHQKAGDEDKLRHQKATVIQSNYRGYKTRKDMKNKQPRKGQNDDDDDDETDTA